MTNHASSFEPDATVRPRRTPHRSLHRGLPNRTARTPGRTEHGWTRRAQAPLPSTEPDERAGETPVGPRAAQIARLTHIAVLVIVAVASFVGIVRIRARTQLLQIGAELASLTAEESRLIERKRRLEAERAYLRHPEEVYETATERLGMVAVPPAAIRHISLVTPSSPQGVAP